MMMVVFYEALCAKGRRKKVWGPSIGQLPVKNVVLYAGQVWIEICF